MKKLTLLISIAVLFMTATLISCAADSGSSTTYGYNTITWEKDLAPPDEEKCYEIAAFENCGSFASSTGGENCLAVAYSASDILSATDTSIDSTAVAIISSDRTERLIIIFKNVLLTQPDDDLEGTQNDNVVNEGDIIAKYVNVSNRSVTTSSTGSTTFDVKFVPIAVTQADASTKVHYLAEFTFDSGFTAAGINITTSDRIRAMMYPTINGEPDLTD